MSYTFEYDAWGNTTKALVGGNELARYSYAPNNGLLSSMTYKNGDTLSYTYGNLNRVQTKTYDQQTGLRIKKTVGSTEYTYYYAGGQLMRMEAGNDIFDFFYDSNGDPRSVKYNGTLYYYITNLQGDVVRIVNASGASIGVYKYDAWGNILYQTDAALINKNPLRYRGYIYDTDTGFYYVSSRYYDPKIGRFLNADNAIMGTGGNILGYNMFSYCFNNPVNMSDPTGNWPKWLENTVKVVSVVVAVTAAVATVAAVSAFTAGTGSAAAVYGASILLGAALSGINGGIANEAKGNSYTNGYLGGASGGAIQSACSKYPGGVTIGGGVGVAIGTAVTDVMNNLDPDSKNSTAQEIVSNAVVSGGKATVTSSITEYVGIASGVAVDTGANGLMPTYSFGFGEAVKSFFGWADDALVYLWE